MRTMIPHTVLLGILASKSSAETIVASLNETETSLSSLRKKLHGNAKRVYPFWKACLNCNKPFPTYTKEQAVRNKTCGQACVNARVAAANSGKKPPELCAGLSQAACAVCGKVVWRNTKHLSRVRLPVCSTHCNGTIRGVALKTHAHKGRANWSAKSEAEIVVRMTGQTNPAWKGGLTYHNRKGKYGDQRIKYVRCPVLLQAMARKDGYVMEHRLNVAQAIGRPLTRVETVHHRNHNATINRLSNLMLFATNAEHKAYEHGAAIVPLWCGWCHSITPEKSGACECLPAHSLRCVAA